MITKPSPALIIWSRPIFISRGLPPENKYLTPPQMNRVKHKKPAKIMAKL